MVGAAGDLLDGLQGLQVQRHGEVVALRLWHPRPIDVADAQPSVRAVAPRVYLVCCDVGIVNNVVLQTNILVTQVLQLYKYSNLPSQFWSGRPCGSLPR